ncbi:MAG: zinc ribbon domain-containing protein [Tannerella sp.]|jgi:uncharacterized membrane protein|nr:zinc ribbon domain-containing protein [Tannerella sp.]
MTEVTPTPDKDVQDNKLYAILAYFSILFLIPLLAAKESPYARFHANQGCILFILDIAVWIVLFIISFITALILPSLLFIIGIINLLLYLGLAVLVVIGIINAAKGEKKELPFIGKYQIIK